MANEIIQAGNKIEMRLVQRWSAGQDEQPIQPYISQFVEWVDYDSKGNPETVYFTEANANHQATNRISGAYYPDFDGIVKAWDFDKFINRGEFIGYVVAK